MGPLQLRIFCESLKPPSIKNTDTWLIPQYPLSVINLWLFSLPAHLFALALQCWPVLQLSPHWKSNLAEIWGVPQGIRSTLTGQTHKPCSLTKPGKVLKCLQKNAIIRVTGRALNDGTVLSTRLAASLRARQAQGRQESPSFRAKEAHWGFPGEHCQNWRENRDNFLASDGKQLSLDTA